MVEPPVQPITTYPQTQVQVTPDGVLLITTLAPGFAFTSFVNNESMRQIIQEMAKARRGVKPELELIQHVNKTRNN